MEEVWKDIPGYEGYYQVSNLSRIRSLDRYVTQSIPQRNISYKRLIKGSIMHEWTTDTGYNTVELRKNNKRDVRYVHRLVAEAFIPNPNNKPDINHINYITTDNRIENLEWVNEKENAIHSAKRLRGGKRIYGKHKYIRRTSHNTYNVKIILESIDYRFDKTFKTLEEAINARNIKLKEIDFLDKLDGELNA